MKNPFALTLTDKADQQPVVILDEGRSGLITHLRLDACERELPAGIASLCAPSACDTGVVWREDSGYPVRKFLGSEEIGARKCNKTRKRAIKNK